MDADQDQSAAEEGLVTCIGCDKPRLPSAVDEQGICALCRADGIKMAAPDARPRKRPQRRPTPTPKPGPVTVSRSGDQDQVMHGGQPVGWTSHHAAGWYAFAVAHDGWATWCSRPCETKQAAVAALVAHLEASPVDASRVTVHAPG